MGRKVNAVRSGEHFEVESETTIYDNAVRDETSEVTFSRQRENGLGKTIVIPNRFSTSLEEGELDTSDETTELDRERRGPVINVEHSFTDRRPEHDEMAVPSTSGFRPRRQDTMGEHLEWHDHRQHQLTPEEKAQKLIQEAEAHKAKRVYDLPGKSPLEISKQIHSVMVDDDYLLVASHVDPSTLNKIILGEYVDFAKLLPRDKILQEEDQRLEVVVRGGHTYWVPAQDRDGVQSIQGFARWEQAFRVYSDIYLRNHPERSTELIQYNHIIYTASLTYIWENVYAYDKDFRLHMGRHPERSWGIILQQAWSMRLKDKLGRGFEGSGTVSRKHEGTPKRQEDNEAIDINRICRRFNKGRCSFGPTCKFDHRCFYCFKFGHSIHHCRKLRANKERGRDRDRKHHKSQDNFRNDDRRGDCGAKKEGDAKH